MNTDHFYDFDQSREHQIEPKYNREDLIDTDNNPILCDICNNGVKLAPFGQDRLICPNCMNVYNPKFDTIKHETIETTIEDMQDTHSGTLSYVEDSKHEPTKTRIRKKLGLDEALPDYVKKEIDFIQWRPGYKTVPLDKKLFSSKDK
jgi:uncharacterized CHY-type Zn-finger protein